MAKYKTSLDKEERVGGWRRWDMHQSDPLLYPDYYDGKMSQPAGFWESSQINGSHHDTLTGADTLKMEMISNYGEFY